MKPKLITISSTSLLSEIHPKNDSGKSNQKKNKPNTRKKLSIGRINPKSKQKRKMNLNIDIQSEEEKPQILEFVDDISPIKENLIMRAMISDDKGEQTTLKHLKPDYHQKENFEFASSNTDSNVLVKVMSQEESETYRDGSHVSISYKINSNVKQSRKLKQLGSKESVHSKRRGFNTCKAKNKPGGGFLFDMQLLTSNTKQRSPNRNYPKSCKNADKIGKVEVIEISNQSNFRSGFEESINDSNRTFKNVNRQSVYKNGIIKYVLSPKSKYKNMSSEYNANSHEECRKRINRLIQDQKFKTNNYKSLLEGKDQEIERLCAKIDELMLRNNDLNNELEKLRLIKRTSTSKSNKKEIKPALFDKSSRKESGKKELVKKRKKLQLDISDIEKAEKEPFKHSSPTGNSKLNMFKNKAINQNSEKKNAKRKSGKKDKQIISEKTAKGRKTKTPIIKSFSNLKPYENAFRRLNIDKREIASKRPENFKFKEILTPNVSKKRTENHFKLSTSSNKNRNNNQDIKKMVADFVIPTDNKGSEGYNEAKRISASSQKFDYRMDPNVFKCELKTSNYLRGSFKMGNKGIYKKVKHEKRELGLK